ICLGASVWRIGADRKLNPFEQINPCCQASQGDLNKPRYHRIAFPSITPGDCLVRVRACKRKSNPKSSRDQRNIVAKCLGLELGTGAIPRRSTPYQARRPGAGVLNRKGHYFLNLRSRRGTAAGDEYNASGTSDERTHNTICGRLQYKPGGAEIRSQAVGYQDNTFSVTDALGASIKIRRHVPSKHGGCDNNN